MREEEIKQLEIDKIHWRDLYWEECEKNKRLKEERDMHRDAAKDCGYDIRDLEEENRKLESERDKWRGKYNRLKSEFNLLKNKIGTTQK